MRLFRFECTQILPVTLGEAWAFFSDPGNLAKITPPSLNLAPDSPVPAAMHPGMIVTYRIKVFPGLSMTWVTEITHVEAPNFFVDEQRFGPYRFWHHLHRFTPCEQGVVAEDMIHYGLHGGPLAGAINTVAVLPQLRKIFEFRRSALTDRFGSAN
jgi:ligand-binding SRPBCC domain-containing protein